MAKIYSKGTDLYGVDKTLILGVREALVYPTPFKDWTSLKFGFFGSFVPAGTDNDDIPALTNYTINPIAGNRDRILFGMKRNTKKFPGESGEPYLGLYNIYTHATISSDSNSNLTVGGQYGPAIFPTALLENGGVSCPSAGEYGYFTTSNVTESHGSSYAFFFGMMFSVRNKGTANQQVEIRYICESPFSDTRIEALKSKITSTAYGNNSVVDFAYSGIPCTLPDSVFLYIPFGGLNLRIHNIAVLKVS